MNDVAPAPAPAGLNSANGEHSSSPPSAPTLLPVQPAQPPGRRSRKAKAYADQIQHLHAQGYSIEVIREALAEVGVIASWSTVQREADREPSAPSRAPPRQQELPAHSVACASSPIDRTTDASSISAEVRGKEFAEAFMNSRVDNPLLRKERR